MWPARKPSRTSLLLLLIAALTACGTTDPPAPPAIGQYSCLQVPSGFEGPGTIMRRDGAGNLFLVYNLLGDAALRNAVYTAQNVQTAAATRTGAEAASLTMGLLQQLLPGFSANIVGEAQGQWAGSVTYTGVDEHRTYDDPMHRAALAWMQTASRVPGSDYFLIRDALSARSMTMELSAQQVSSLGLDAVLERAASGRANVSLTRGATYRLTSDFSTPLFVCITRERLVDVAVTAPPGVAGAPSATALGGGDQFQRVFEVSPLPPTRLAPANW